VDGIDCACGDLDVEVLVAVAEGGLRLLFNFLVGDAQTSTELFALHLLLVRLDLVLDLVLNLLVLGECFFSGILEALELLLSVGCKDVPEQDLVVEVLENLGLLLAVEGGDDNLLEFGVKALEEERRDSFVDVTDDNDGVPFDGVTAVRICPLTLSEIFGEEGVFRGGSVEGNDV